MKGVTSLGVPKDDNWISTRRELQSEPCNGGKEQSPKPQILTDADHARRQFLKFGFGILEQAYQPAIKVEGDSSRLLTA